MRPQSLLDRLQVVWQEFKVYQILHVIGGCPLILIGPFIPSWLAGYGAWFAARRLQSFMWENDHMAPHGPVEMELRVRLPELG